MHDHRTAPRWQISWQALVLLPPKETLVKCYITDINFKGMRISLDKELKKDTFVHMTMVLSNELAFDFEAWVVWHGTTEGMNTYGLYFTKMKQPDKDKIQRFIEKHTDKKEEKKEKQAVTKKQIPQIKEILAEKGEEQGMDDRRVFERFITQLPLRFFTLEGKKEGKGQTFDISAKGLGLLTREEIAEQTPLEMWLEMPDKGGPLYARGKVAWSAMVEPNLYRSGIELERADLMGLSRVLRAG